jgi:hypothetical protein
MPRTQVGSDEILDATISNADVASGAAISGTKVSPDFGSQNIKTSGYEELVGSSAPSGVAGSARLYFDSVANKLKVSENNGAFVDILGSGVSGTGVSGRLAFWNGAASLSSDTNLFWDDANNRLGVGTTTPSYGIDVVGDINASSSVRVGGTSIGFPAGSSSQIQYNNSGVFGASSNVWTNGTSGLQVGLSNFFGVPANSFSVVVSGGGEHWLTAGLLHLSRASVGSSALDVSVLNNTYVSYDTNTAHSFTGGNFGIANTAPESALDVSFTSGKWARFGDQAWSTRIGQLANGYQWIGSGVNRVAPDSVYYAKTGNNVAVNHLVMEMRTSNTNGGFNFFGQTHAVDGTVLAPNTILHLDVNGNVGIANQGPASLFSVGSTSQFQVDTSGSVLTSSTGYMALGGATLGSGSQRIKLPDSEFIVWNTTSAKIGAGATNMVINAAVGASNAVLVNYGGAGTAGGGGFAVYDGAISPVLKFRVDPAGTTSYIQGAFGVNASSLNAAAQLQVDSTTKGFLPPRMTTTQRDAIVSPPVGLTIFNTTTNQLESFT